MIWSTAIDHQVAIDLEWRVWRLSSVNLPEAGSSARCVWPSSVRSCQTFGSMSFSRRGWLRPPGRNHPSLKIVHPRFGLLLHAALLPPFVHGARGEHDEPLVALLHRRHDGGTPAAVILDRQVMPSGRDLQPFELAVRLRVRQFDRGLNTSTVFASTRCASSW
jgi:hypothetical protein